MSPTLHGAYMSTCTRRVLATAFYYGLKEDVDFTVDNITEFSVIKSEAWVAKQPFGQMPYLDDGDFVLFESRAIARYFAAQSGKLPTDPKKLALVDQAISAEVSHFDPSASGLAYEMVFKGMHGRGAADPEKVKELQAKLAEKLAVYEVILSKQKYLAGDELTIADLNHLPYGQMVVNLGVAPSLVDGSLPHVAAWWKELSSLPAWAEANAKVPKH